MLDVTQKAEQIPIQDTSDGSTSWFDMHHEEGLAFDRHGNLLEHLICGPDSETIHFSVKAAQAAADGGMIMHSHPVPGTSFSAVDLATVATNRSRRGMVVVATTSHPVGGVYRPVRYILDTRHRAKPESAPSRQQIERSWDEEFLRVGRELRNSDTGELGYEEGNALYMHMIMARLCRRYDVEYQREVLK